MTLVGRSATTAMVARTIGGRPRGRTLRCAAARGVATAMMLSPPSTCHGIMAVQWRSSSSCFLGGHFRSTFDRLGVLGPSSSSSSSSTSIRGHFIFERPRVLGPFCSGILHPTSTYSRIMHPTDGARILHPSSQPAFVGRVASAMPFSAGHDHHIGSGTAVFMADFYLWEGGGGGPGVAHCCLFL